MRRAGATIAPTRPIIEESNHLSDGSFYLVFSLALLEGVFSFCCPWSFNDCPQQRKPTPCSHGLVFWLHGIFLQGRMLPVESPVLMQKPRPGSYRGWKMLSSAREFSSSGPISSKTPGNPRASVHPCTPPTPLMQWGLTSCPTMKRKAKNCESMSFFVSFPFRKAKTQARRNTFNLAHISHFNYKSNFHSSQEEYLRCLLNQTLRFSKWLHKT